ncbi:MFS general substrate transporter [Viridothelium virens]|uniref:MFS general substrate transporter n=1 Tax=Viridothelium virens TaxID=1048519 RepID=A0A6A6GV68_VIRVR|nr:MFS general substrate transporter [Viridothelium virens]
MGNVKILQQGTPDSLKASLGLHGTQFNWAVSVAYIAVTALLIPSNLLMKKISARWFFPLSMMLWGCIVMSFAGVKGFGGLLAGRFALGIPESGVGPCCLLYFSFWYKPSERAFRIGVLHSAGSLATAVSGFLALALNNLNGKGGLKAWQWVFIVEGSLPILLSPLLWLCLLTYPEDTKALSERERYIAINRFGRGSTRKTDVTWSWPAFCRILSRPSTYVFFISFISLGIVASAQGTFLPTFLSTLLHFSIAKSNLFTSIVKLSVIPLYWGYGYHSDWTHERMWHYIIPALTALPRYAVWTYASSHPGHPMSNISLYGLSFIGQMVQVGPPILLAYRSATLYGACEQAVGVAVAVASASIANILAPQLYPEQHAPRFLPGFSTTCGLLAL